MTDQWKPEGYPSVSPYLIVDDTSTVIQFLKDTFDAIERRRYDAPDGSIMHIELQIDDSIIMMADGGDEYPSFPSLIHIYVQDVDETYQRAIEAGGTSIQEPVQADGDPDKRGSVKDPSGNTWSFATQMT